MPDNVLTITPETSTIAAPLGCNDILDQLANTVDNFKEAGQFSIIIAQIDPDAIGSAFGMQAVILQLGGDAAIFYQGKVGHPQNEALCNKLGLMGRMLPLDTSDPGLHKTLTNPVLVDSSRVCDSRLPFTISPVIVVDHHGQSDVVATDENCVWVDESAGSACTMVVEIMDTLRKKEEAATWEVKSDVAIMLALGIYTDCKGNTRTGERDDLAYSWAKRYADTAVLTSMVNYKRPFSFLQHLARAVAYVGKYDTYRKGRILGGLGRIPEKSGDDLAMVADEFLRTVGAPLAVTWALIESKDRQTGETCLKIRVCARSEDYTTNLAETLNNRFGKKSGAKILPDGTAEGGALFEFPVGPWLKDDEMEEIANRRIIEWFFNQDESSPSTD